MILEMDEKDWDRVFEVNVKGTFLFTQAVGRITKKQGSEKYMFKPDVNEYKEKQRRVREFFENTGYEALIIGRRDNFAWYTCGGDNRVITTTERGFTVLVITQDKTYCVAHLMDGPRVFDEELQGLEIEPMFLKWYEATLEEKAVQLTKGKKVISDIPVDMAECLPEKIYSMHYPLTEKEIEKCGWIGEKVEEIVCKVADEIKPGITEYDIQAMMLQEFGRYDIIVDNLLVGSDERILKYRHPVPTDKKVERFVLLHPAVKKRGLHANITRMLYLGDKVPDDIQKKYDIANMLEAAAVSMCIPGGKFSTIFDTRKKLLKQYGFEDEWERHFTGGPTGYQLCDACICNDPEAIVSPNQTYDWFITLPGVKVEELSVNTSKGWDILSVTGKWPVKEYSYDSQTFELPQILLK